MNEAETGKFLNSPELQRMTSDEKERVAQLLENPGQKEFFFFRTLLGKTPAQIRNMMIKEFIRRFDLAAYAETIAKELPTRRSWRELDMAVTKFGGAMEVEEHRLFWDRMRYVLEALPQRKEYGNKYADGYDPEAIVPEDAWQYDTCKFCWRIVPRHPGLPGKNGIFCFAHDLPSRHSTYRRHDRLHSRMYRERRSVVKKLMELVESHPSDEDMHKAVLDCLRAPNEYLPRLAEHLGRVGHDGTPESLLWAFHGPVSDDMDMRYRDALGEYIRRRLTAKDPLDPSLPLFIFDIDELSRAEAWLTLLDRDGRRKKGSSGFFGDGSASG